MVMSILIEVTMFMVMVMVMVAISRVSKVAITTKPPSETTETPRQSGSLLKPVRWHMRVVVVHLMVIWKVLHVVVILVVVLWMR